MSKTVSFFLNQPQAKPNSGQNPMHILTYPSSKVASV